MRNGIKRDLIIYCDRASGAASELARRLCARRVYSTSTRRIVRTDGSLIINYGTSHTPSWGLGNKSICLNDPQAVSSSISKVASYGKFKEAGIPVLEFTTDVVVGRKWISEGSRVLARRDGLSSGRGISIVEPEQGPAGLDPTDFYTKYFPKTHEYRAHVFKGRVIDITQKKRSTGVSGGEGDGELPEGVRGNRTLHQRVVRSLDNGWVHAHEGLHLPGDARNVISDAACKAVAALGLEFGAVDILAKYSKKQPTRLIAIAVAEVNTAPGLGNEVTIKAYENAINELYEGTKVDRYIPIRRRVRKLVPVTFVSRKGNKITRMRYRRVYE